MTSLPVCNDTETTIISDSSHLVDHDKLLIHWRGEGMEDYTLPFRHLEFLNAIEAVLHDNGYDDNAIPNSLPIRTICKCIFFFSIIIDGGQT